MNDPFFIHASFLLIRSVPFRAFFCSYYRWLLLVHTTVCAKKGAYLAIKGVPTISLVFFPTQIRFGRIRFEFIWSAVCKYYPHLTVPVTGLMQSEQIAAYSWFWPVLCQRRRSYCYGEHSPSSPDCVSLRGSLGPQTECACPESTCLPSLNLHVCLSWNCLSTCPHSTCLPVLNLPDECVMIDICWIMW